ncbi:hypothetical protein OAS96_00660 [Candidatus Pelagibacter sp.]|nr:hypothetical protein [Candidatus Pelagibacter sp.]|tara:strand:+ start:168 stop:389 length:222 start_codon:yes stop_codon:yes gene_type:complete
MENDYLINKRSIKLKQEIKTITSIEFLPKKKSVDINKLLNRVKINEKKKKKENILMLGIATFIVGCSGIIIFF